MADIASVTKDDFSAYEDVRESGVLIMLSPRVRELAGLSRETHLAIIEHYEALCAKWPDIHNQSPSPPLHSGERREYD